MLQSLKRGFFKYQVNNLAWTSLTLVFVFTLSFFQIYNLYKGYYWVVFPILCIPINTFYASIIGQAVGKNVLHKLIPNKTIEGYLGGMFCTAVTAYYVRIFSSEFLIDIWLSLKVWVSRMPTDFSDYKNVRRIDLLSPFNIQCEDHHLANPKQHLRS